MAAELCTPGAVQSAEQSFAALEAAADQPLPEEQADAARQLAVEARQTP